MRHASAGLPGAQWWVSGPPKPKHRADVEFDAVTSLLHDNKLQTQCSTKSDARAHIAELRSTMPVRHSSDTRFRTPLDQAATSMRLSAPVPTGEDPDIVYVRVRPRWVRCADFRPESFGFTEVTFS